MELCRNRLLNVFRYSYSSYISALKNKNIQISKAYKCTQISAGRSLESVHKGSFGQPDFSSHPHLMEYGEVTPGLTRDEYQMRREQLMTSIKSSATHHEHHVVIIPSATTQYMSADIPYIFRQNTDFLYLCGFKEPDSVLVLENKPGVHSSEVKSTLFVPKKDQNRELWDGPRSGIDGSVILTGVDHAHNNDDLNLCMKSYRTESNLCMWFDTDNPSNSRFHQNIVDDVLLLESVAKVETVRPLIHQLRVVKSPAEIALMEQTCQITCDAFREVMRYTAPTTDEAFLHALMEYNCRIHGAQCLGYPPVVASGSRANVIHYVSNNQVVSEDDLILLDAGCEMHGYNSDVTRTYPAKGYFSNKQEEVYEALLWVQEQLVFQCVPGNSLAILYNNMIVLLARQLKQLCIIPKYLEGEALQEAVKQYCPHDVGHFLGMDIHDTSTVPRMTPFVPGMILTIEPGLYIPECDTSAPPEWRGIGMRIEDNILVTDYLPNNLTSFAPKTVSEIEQAMINTC